MKHKLSKKASEQVRARIRFLKIKNLTIEPQSTSYAFHSTRPTRIGDLAQIAVEGDNGFVPYRTGWPTRIRTVILLADGSGRRWLVECA